MSIEHERWTLSLNHIITFMCAHTHIIYEIQWSQSHHTTVSRSVLFLKPHQREIVNFEYLKFGTITSMSFFSLHPTTGSEKMNFYTRTYTNVELYCIMQKNRITYIVLTVGKFFQASFWRHCVKNNRSTFLHSQNSLQEKREGNLQSN